LKWFFIISLFALFGFRSYGQALNCTFKPPSITIHFGTGFVRDINSEELYNYSRVGGFCPSDGYYAYASYTAACFRDDWHTLTEDHTPGDVDGNMLLVNGAPSPGVFFRTTIGALKPNTTYEFGVWLMNLCKPSEKCPFPLLPNLMIRLETDDGKIVAKISTGEIVRVPAPHWTQHRAVFTTPASLSSLTLVMADAAPGGCGNDFAMDDITFRECVIPPPVTKTTAKPPVVNKTTKPAPSTKPVVVAKVQPKKTNPVPEKKEAKVSQVMKPRGDTGSNTITIVKAKSILPPPPLVLTTRENSLVKKIETEAGELKIELYDNGEIDGDTVSIYHNNTLIKSRAGLSQKPISFSIPINASQPHHELIMVANNLGSIPPNTSVMIITCGTNRYEVFISSTETKNAKVVIDLKK